MFKMGQTVFDLKCINRNDRVSPELRPSGEINIKFVHRKETAVQKDTAKSFDNN